MANRTNYVSLSMDNVLREDKDTKSGYDLSKDYDNLKERLIDLRKSRGHSQNYLCQQAGIIQSSYVSYEKGLKKIPLSAIFKLCRFYQISLSEFFDYDN